MMKIFGFLVLILCVFSFSPVQAQEEERRSTYNVPSAASSGASSASSRPIYSSKNTVRRSSGSTYSSSSGPLYLNRATYSNNVVPYSTDSSRGAAYATSREELIARRAQMESDYQRRLAQGDTDFQKRRAARQAAIDESRAAIFGPEKPQDESYNLQSPEGFGTTAKKKKRSVYRRNAGLQSPERVFNSVR